MNLCVCVCPLLCDCHPLAFNSIPQWNNSVTLCAYIFSVSYAEILFMIIWCLPWVLSAAAITSPSELLINQMGQSTIFTTVWLRRTGADYLEWLKVLVSRDGEKPPAAQRHWSTLFWATLHAQTWWGIWVLQARISWLFSSSEWINLNHRPRGDKWRENVKWRTGCCSLKPDLDLKYLFKHFLQMEESSCMFHQAHLSINNRL